MRAVTPAVPTGRYDWLAGAARGPTIAFAIRTTVATLLSLWVGFRLQLGSAYAAPVTIWLISKPALRATVARSIARLVGTVAGCVGAIVLMATAAQSPVTAVLLIGVWVAACAAGATLALAPNRSYTFELAGFSLLTAIVGSVADPNRAFLLSIDQCTVVCVGVASVFVVDALFPFRIDEPPDPAGPRTKGTVADAGRSAAIAGGAVVAAGAFWMATGWPSGVSFLFAAGLVTVFFAPTLIPDVRALEWSLAALLAGLVGAVYTFAILPHFTAFAGLALALAPVLVLGGLGVANPRLAQSGLMIFMAFLFILMQPANGQRIDPETFFNNAMAYALGGVFGTVAFRVAGRGTLR